MYERLKTKVAVLASGKGYREFKEKTKDINFFELRIKNGNKNRENS